MQEARFRDSDLFDSAGLCGPNHACIRTSLLDRNTNRCNGAVRWVLLYRPTLLLSSTGIVLMRSLCLQDIVLRLLLRLGRCIGVWRPLKVLLWVSGITDASQHPLFIYYSIYHPSGTANLSCFFHVPYLNRLERLFLVMMLDNVLPHALPPHSRVKHYYHNGMC
jgi:hypothetical protein